MMMGTGPETKCPSQIVELGPLGDTPKVRDSVSAWGLPGGRERESLGLRDLYLCLGSHIWQCSWLTPGSVHRYVLENHMK